MVINCKNSSVVEERALTTHYGLNSPKSRLEKQVPIAEPRKFEIIYKNVFTMAYFHLAALYGIYLLPSVKKETIIFVVIYGIFGGFGITGGAHRLWAHKTYKAKYYAEIFILLCNCIANQQSVIQWVRDHRLHHKYSDTDADPHNARRGFFYSHIGWLMVRKNDWVKERGKTIDMSDILNNPLLQFQKKYAVPLFGTFCFVLPTAVPMLFWGETFIHAWHISTFRYMMNLHGSLLVNSFAHLYGNKPYDKNILPVQNYTVSFFAIGEGFHNYHHCFPWDYRAAELGNNFLNLTTKMLDFFAWMGWVYDLKTAKPEMIKKKMQSTGDGTDCYGFKRDLLITLGSYMII